MPDFSALLCIAPYMADHMPWFMPTLALVVGAVFGSYLTCALYRVPRGQSLWMPPSQCPSCKNTLKAVDLVPVGSWLWFRGRCRQCGVKIPARYLWVEVLSIAAALLSLWLTKGGFSFLFAYGAMAAFVAAGVFFFGHRQWPLKSVAFGLLCLCLYVLFQQPMFACGARFY